MSLMFVVLLLHGIRTSESRSCRGEARPFVTSFGTLLYTTIIGDGHDSALWCYNKIAVIAGTVCSSRAREFPAWLG